jgi:hypothetical protein
MSCLFCLKEEKYNKNNNINYICSKCVQVLLRADQDDLKRAHKKAVEKKYYNKLSALESFIIPEEIENVRPERNSNGKGINRPVRNKKGRIRQSA